MAKVKPVIVRTPKQLAEALGLPLAEAREWQVQYELAGRLREIARKQKYTHAEIAARSGSSRTRITAILNGDLEHVSTDLLIRILTSLGYRVRVSVVKSAA
jgi:predicted XRE-type DNA-binding protein